MALIQESHLRKRDVNRLQNKYFKVAALSSDDTKTKGSIVLLSRKCVLTVDKSIKDLSGRISYICTTIRSRKIAFVLVYAPSTYDESFFPLLTNEFLSLNEYSLIIGGDINAVDLNRDR